MLPYFLSSLSAIFCFISFLLIIFIVICAVVGFAIKLLAGIPIVGILAWILGACLEVYSIIGIVLCILKFLGIL